MLATLITIATAVSGQTLGTPKSIQEVVDQLAKRNSTIDSVYCTYEFRAKKFFDDMPSKEKSGPSARTPTLHTEGEFVEGRNGLFRLTLKSVDDDGKLFDRRVISYDGRENWAVRSGSLGPDEPPPSTTKGGDSLKSYIDESYPRRAIMETVLSVDGTPRFSTHPVCKVIQYHQDRCVFSRKTIGDVECIALSWQEDSESGTTRRTLWLDLARGLVLRRHTEERRMKGSDDWIRTATWEVPDVGSTGYVTTEGVKREYWYPRTVFTEISNGTGRKMFEQRITVTNLRLNQRLDPRTFTPEIEDGSEVFDKQKGIGYVQGTRPSPRLRKMIEKRVDQSKKELARLDDSPAPGAMEAPVGWGSVLTWCSLLLGCFGLIVAVILRRHG